MSQSQDVMVTRQDAVLTVTINRPQSRNGLTPDTCLQLAQAFEAASQQEDVRCVVLTGAGTSFCSGADLAAAQAAIGAQPYDELIRDRFHRLIRAIVACPKPVVASIRGAAVGFGFDMALACDLRVASRKSKFGSVFGRIGLVPDGGSSYTLSRLVGLTRAMEMVMLAETFDGQRADELGLLNRLTDDDALESTTNTLAQRLAAGPPIAQRLAKANLIAGTSGTLDQALEREVAAQVQCLGSADMMEGVAAFFQKRPPEFKGR